MRFFKKICIAIFALLVFIMSVLVFLFGTTTGLNLMLKGVVYLVPGLQFTSVSGNWSNLTLNHLYYRIPDVTFSAKEFHLELNLNRLRHFQLCINDLSLNNVKIEVKTSKLGLFTSILKKIDQGSNLIYTHYPLIMQRLALKNIQIKVDNIIIKIDKFNIGFRLQDNILSVMPTYITGLFVTLPKTTQITLNRATNAILQIVNSGTTTNNVAIEKKCIDTQSSLTKILRTLFKQPLLSLLPSFTLPLNFVVEELKGENLHLIGGDTNTNILISRFRMQAVAYNQYAELTLLDIDSPYGWLNATGNAKLSGQWPINVAINTMLNIDPLKEEKIKLTVSGHLRDELHASLKFSGLINAQLRLNTQLAQSGLPLMLMINSQVIQWPLTGTPQYQAKDISMRLYGNIQNYQLILKATLNNKGMPSANITMNAKGNTDFNSVINWQGTISWHNKLSSSINAIWPPTQLYGKFTIQGTMRHGDWRLQVAKLDLNGNIWQNSLTVKGSLISNNIGQWNLPELLLTLGRNTLTIKGELKNQLIFDAILNAPVLNEILPGLTGRAQGNIKLRGDIHAPLLLTELSIHELNWKDLAINYVALKGNIRSSDIIISADMQLQMDQLQYGKSLSKKQLTLITNGNEQKHYLKLAMLKLLMPSNIQASGVLISRIDIHRATRGYSLQNKVSLLGNQVKINQIMQGKTIPIVFETLILNATLDKKIAVFDWLIKIADNGQFAGQIQIADYQKLHNFSGNLNISNLSIAMLNLLIPPDENFDGIINASLRFSGNTQRLQLYGRLDLERLVIRGNFMPFAIIDSQLAVTFTGTNSLLYGLITTTYGQLNFTGNADWSRIETWRVRINAKGNLVRVTVPPMISLNILPEIMFDASPNIFILSGKIDVPWGNIVVKDLLSQNAIAEVSSDEVMLDDNLHPVQNRAKNTNILISSNVLIHIGDDVWIDAFGLKAKLKGDLKISHNKQQGLGLNGKIDILSGRFHAYGQDLIVNTGQLLFSGPIDQPYLNIEAIRNPDSTQDNVTAGVQVIGLANQLKVKFFSNSVKSQQETLSYLLRGQGLDTSSADRNVMTSMLIDIGVSQSGEVIDKIGKIFGVSNLALDTQGIGDDSQVVVSGYITPSLQIKYGVGIFDSLATLTLRYRLMPKLYLEVVSSLNQTIDFLYRFEF